METEAQTDGIDTSSNLIPLAALCIALNVGLGTVVNLLKAPVYLDAIGTILFALLAYGRSWKGFAWSAMVGALSFVIGAIFFNPVLVWFIPTQIAIAAFSYFVIAPSLPEIYQSGAFTKKAYFKIALLGLLLGVVAGVVSAPIIAYVFGGITGAGASLITAFLMKAGETLFTSVVASGLASEPLDKLLQLALAVALFRITPSRVRRIARGG